MRLRSGLLAGCLILAGFSAQADPATQPESPQASTGSTASAARALSKDELRLKRENAEVIRLAAGDNGQLALPTKSGSNQSPDTIWGALVQMVVVLGGVCLLAYLLLAKLLPKILRVPSPTGRPRMLQLVDRMAVDQRSSILVVSVGEQYFMLGNSESGLNLISQLDAESVLQADEQPPPTPGGFSRFKEALTGQRSKES
jgi:flagellar biogenesis protein FliO